MHLCNRSLPVATSYRVIHHQMMRIRIAGLSLVLGAALLFSSLCVRSAAQMDLIGDVRAQLAQNSFRAADAELATIRVNMA